MQYSVTYANGKSVDIVDVNKKKSIFDNPLNFSDNITRKIKSICRYNTSDTLEDLNLQRGSVLFYSGVEYYKNQFWIIKQPIFKNNNLIIVDSENIKKEAILSFSSVKLFSHYFHNVFKINDIEFYNFRLDFDRNELKIECAKFIYSEKTNIHWNNYKYIQSEINQFFNNLDIYIKKHLKKKEDLKMINNASKMINEIKKDRENIMTKQKEKKEKISKLFEESNTRINDNNDYIDNIDNLKNIDIIKSDSITSNYINITSNINDVTKHINNQLSLNSVDDLLGEFEKTKRNLEENLNMSPRKGIYKYIDKLFNKSNINSPDINDSIQMNIEYVFELLNIKYEEMVMVGDNLNKSKKMMILQITKLEELKELSQEKMDIVKNNDDILLSDISVHNKIIGSILKYKNRLKKIDGSIMAMRLTIIELSKELPSLQSDLVDEMALGSLLTNTTKYQNMFNSLKGLVSNIVEINEENTFNVVEQLFDMQINDTTSIDYLNKNQKNSEKFVKMLDEKNKKISNKILSDKKEITKFLN